MAKKVAFTPKPRVEKLPLAVRKDIRDKWESKKEDLEAQISELLGEKYVVNIDPQAIWAYATESTNGAGYLFAGYIEGFAYALKYFIENYEEEGKRYFNKAVTQSEITIAVDPRGNDGETISTDIKDGVFRILFKHDSLGYNLNSLDKSNFVKAIDEVTNEPFSLKARSSIEKEWEENVEEITKDLSEILNLPDLVLDPNFEEVYAAVKAEKMDDSNWEFSFGKAIREYFEGFKYQLNYAGFKDDDMLQEGFAEAVSAKTIKLRVVKTLKTGYRNEAEVGDDGVLYLQVKASEWYYNVNDMGDNIVKLL